MATSTPSSPTLQANRLLSLLDDKTLAAIGDEMTFVQLPHGTQLLTERRPIRYAWFPVEGVMSMIGSVEGAHAKIEVGTVGNEGMVGLPLFLGASRAPGECFAQVSGAGWRMPAAAFMEAADAHPAFARVLHRYTQALMVQISQSTACNRAHAPLQRCARWLLMTRDRTGSDTFDLTQEYLGQMLGERRPTVSRSASMLQQKRAITYSRGRVTVIDRAKLEEISCPCYGVVRAEYDAMLKR